MKTKAHPKFQQERLRLRLRLEQYKQLMQEDVQELKASIHPMALVKNVVGQAKENLGFSAGANLAMKFIPGAKRIGPVGRLLLPLIVKNVPRIAQFVAEKKPSFKKSSFLGGMKNAIHKLRARIKPQ